uniref:Uncharacterized protein n=1 Tax=Rhizophora mucronata TaxID=61149 RepID=A0A2P2Q953_RHIMU
MSYNSQALESVTRLEILNSSLSKNQVI